MAIRQTEFLPGELQDKVLQLRRVSRKTVGGNAVSFSVLVAVGDRQGRLGIGLAKAGEVPAAIAKAIAQAKKRMLTITFKSTTIPYDMNIKFKAVKLLLKPAPKGTGLKVGGVIRPIMELIGIKDLSGKIYASNNKINIAYALYEAFKKLKQSEK